VTRHDEITTALARDLETLPRLNGFRLRGLNMTRLESFVDATFAFAITVLIIAGQQVPDDVAALLTAFRDVPTFAASIAVLAIFWKGHWLWSRRFGLEDDISIYISWAMIFTMLVYVYPLKVVFGAMFHLLSGGYAGHKITVYVAEGRQLFSLYALGFGAIAFEILLLNWRAWHLRDALRLNEREQLMTRDTIVGWAIPVSVAMLSLLLALFLPPAQLPLSGWVYYLLIVLVPWHRRRTRLHLKRSSVLADIGSPGV
jgi:uncharacterized membrane protein